MVIDENLLNEAHDLGNELTKEDTINQALKEYIARRKRLRVLDAFGKLDFDPEF
jgi:hypothetical protein